MASASAAALCVLNAIARSERHHRTIARLGFEEATVRADRSIPLCLSHGR